MLPTPPPERSGWRKLFGLSLDLLYPSACVVCRVGLVDGRGLCAACHQDLPRLCAPFCKVCGEAFEGAIDREFSCPNCSKLSFSFELSRPAMVRDERTLDMIHRLKYGRQIHLADELGRLACEAFGDPRFGVALADGWPLVPVPLHRKRQQDRHFNQAEEIARVLSRRAGLPLLKGLERTRSTETQTRLTRAQRLANLRGAFAVTAHGRRWLAEKSAGAILVDDVLTTGSTVDECAKTLRRGGFEKVFVVTVMRG